MAQSEKIGCFARSLSNLQAELESPSRDSTAEIATKSGGKYSYNYANLDACWEAVKPLLKKNGFSVTQTMGLCVSGGEPAGTLETTLLHVCNECDGQWKSGEQLLLLKAADPQGQGSAITYARRYGLCAILGIIPTDDDDGAAAVESHREYQSRPAAPPKPACPQCGLVGYQPSKYVAGEWYCWNNPKHGGCGYKGSSPESEQEAGNFTTQEAAKDTNPKPASGAAANTTTPSSAPSAPPAAPCDPTPEQWAKLKEIGLENNWPEGFMKLHIDAQQRSVRDKAKVYEAALIKFSQMNEDYADNDLINEEVPF